MKRKTNLEKPTIKSRIIITFVLIFSCVWAQTSIGEFARWASWWNLFQMIIAVVCTTLLIVWLWHEGELHRHFAKEKLKQ